MPGYIIQITVTDSNSEEIATRFMERGSDNRTLKRWTDQTSKAYYFLTIEWAQSITPNNHKDIENGLIHNYFIETAFSHA